MFGIETDSDIVECPYNKAHRILRKRLQGHLIRCRKNHPDAEFQKCPFNVTHLIPEPEYVSHVASCPDRKLITQYMYRTDEAPKQEEIIRHVPLDDEEKWDDTEAPDFKPKKLIEAAAAKMKTERNDDIRALKRERTRSPVRSRSRSRSPVYRMSNERDLATSSRHMISTRRSIPINSDLPTYEMDDDPYYSGKSGFGY